MTFGHDNFNWTPVTFGSEETVNQQPTKTFRSVANPLWKPFMPSTWKWMRTSGTPNIFNYQNNTGETTTVSFKLPNAYIELLTLMTDGLMKLFSNDISLTLSKV